MTDFMVSPIQAPAMLMATLVAVRLAPRLVPRSRVRKRAPFANERECHGGYTPTSFGVARSRSLCLLQLGLKVLCLGMLSALS
jgi:hypothetical protein